MLNEQECDVVKMALSTPPWDLTACMLTPTPSHMSALTKMIVIH